MFIRTKDGVYELVDTYYSYVGGVETYMYDNKGRGVEINSHQILNQADTIEELCDYFLIDKNDIEHYEPTTLLIFDDYDDFRYSMFGYEFASGYGCIKTDRGLIYVAKMNEDGDLQLLWID